MIQLPGEPPKQLSPGRREHDSRPVLGILTLYLDDRKTLEERAIYQRMTIAAKGMGMDIMVFTPADVNFETNRIEAMYYDPSRKIWSRKWSAFPHMIFDRCRIQKSHRFEQLKHFRARYGHLTFLNRPLRNKWTVYKTLQTQPKFNSKQPETRLYTSHSDLVEMLKKYPLVFLKPINGTGGRGILRVERLKSGEYLIQGREQTRAIIPPQKVGANSLKSRLQTWNLGDGRYIVQQGIMIKLQSGRVHDYRMLVQKNSRGEWEPTGCAGRVGAPGSITSNLHGGGKAVVMEELLDSWIGSQSEAASVRREAEKFSLEVAAYLEGQFGRLCELALDLAIDRKGGIWLLEVNPKPAREVFRQSGDLKTYERAIIKPLEYAMYLYSRISEKNAGDGATDSPAHGNLNKGSRSHGSRSDGNSAMDENSPLSTTAQPQWEPENPELVDPPSENAKLPVSVPPKRLKKTGVKGIGARTSMKKKGSAARPIAVNKPVIRSVQQDGFLADEICIDLQGDISKRDRTRFLYRM